MGQLRVTDAIAIDESELAETFVQSSGPGGQNVNKVATAVQLRFDIARSSLRDDIRARLVTLAGQRVTKDGVLIITARQFRTQERNRAAARERLVELIRRAAEPPRPRYRTRIPKASKRKRLDDKKSRSGLKRDRARPLDD